jgi:hypothetical protein
MKRFDDYVREAHLFLNQKGETMPNTGDWQGRHTAAWFGGSSNGFARCIRNMISVWCTYAEQHQRRYESPIGEDGVLGAEWARMGKSILGMLNGETGNLDCGTVDGLIRSIAAGHGVDSEEL